MKILVENLRREGDPFPWLVTTESGLLIASFRFRKYAERYKKLVKKGGFSIRRKYSPYGRWGLIHVQESGVYDALECVIDCSNGETATAIAQLFRDSKGSFILNGPFTVNN